MESSGTHDISASAQAYWPDDDQWLPAHIAESWLDLSLWFNHLLFFHNERIQEIPMIT